jgi:hypothetical protein
VCRRPSRHYFLKEQIKSKKAREEIVQYIQIFVLEQGGSGADLKQFRGSLDLQMGATELHASRDGWSRAWRL